MKFFSLTRNKKSETYYADHWSNETQKPEVVPRAVISDNNAEILIKTERLCDGPFLTTWSMIQERGTGNLSEHAMYLNDAYDWAIVRDNEGVLCLVPLKRDIAVQSNPVVTTE